jgi:uncharacterized C2H2 Zn-finger protein
MLRKEEYACPVCGRVCESLAEYHKHWKKEHEQASRSGRENQ